LPFTKKVWVPGEKIPATELNRIETGIDDVYDQAVELSANKTFDDGIEIPYNVKLIRSVAGVSKAEIYLDASGKLLLVVPSGAGFDFKKVTGEVAPLTLKNINGIPPDAHAYNHMRGGSDRVAREADIAIDVNGDGDYTTLAAGLAALSDGDSVFIAKGTFSEVGNFTISENDVTIRGAGFSTQLDFTSTSQPGIIVTGDRVKISDLIMANGNYIGTVNLLQVSAEHFEAHRLFLETNKRALSLQSGKSFGKIFDCFISGLSSPVAGIQAYDRHLIKGCQILGFPLGIDLQGDGNEVDDCILIGASKVSGTGVDITGDYNTITGTILHKWQYPFLANAGADENFINKCIAKSYATFFNDSGGANTESRNTKDSV